MKRASASFNSYSERMPKPSIAVCLLLALTIASCSPANDRAVATGAIEQFHRRYNNYSFSEIYDEALPGLRSKMPKEAFLASIKAMREGQGAVLKTKEIGVDYHYSPDGTAVKMLYEVTYEKGVAKEEFIWTIIDGKGRLSSYRFIMP